MSEPNWPIPYPAVPDSACTSLMRLATLGGVVGGAAAAAANARRMRQGELELGAAMASTSRAALTSAVATALAGAVAGTLTEQGLLRLGLMFTTGALVLYGLDRWSTHQEEAQDV